MRVHVGCMHGHSHANSNTLHLDLITGGLESMGMDSCPMLQGEMDGSLIDELRK